MTDQPLPENVLPNVAPETNPPVSAKLRGTMDLLKESLGVFKDRFWTLIGIQAIPLVVIGIPLIAILGIGLTFSILTQGTASTASILTLVLVGLVVLVAFAIVAAWSGAAVMIAIRDRAERIGIKESYRRAKEFIGAWWGVCLLAGFLTLGGFVLLVVPGILFAVWFMFGLQVLVAENIRGMNALMKSKEYIRGYWWPVVGRLVLVYGFLYIIQAIVEHIDIGGLTIIWYVVSVLAGFVLTVYNFLIYENLRAIKGSDVVATSKKGGLITAGVIGLVLIPVVFFAVMSLSLGDARSKAADAKRMVELRQLQTGLELYHLEHSEYPPSLDSLTPDYLPQIPTQSGIGKPYQYQLQNNGQDYQVCGETKDGAPDCRTKF